MHEYGEHRMKKAMLENQKHICFLSCAGCSGVTIKSIDPQPIQYVSNFTTLMVSSYRVETYVVLKAPLLSVTLSG